MRSRGACGEGHYEVCTSNVAKNFLAIDEEFIIVDTAIEKARKLSTKTFHDLIVVLVGFDRHGMKTRTVRAFASNGRWEWAKRCEPCNGTGQTYSGFGAYACGSCNGMGCVPEYGLTLRPPPLHP